MAFLFNSAPVQKHKDEISCIFNKRVSNESTLDDPCDHAGH